MNNQKIVFPHSSVLLTTGFAFFMGIMVLLWFAVSPGYAQDGTTDTAVNQIETIDITFAQLDQPPIDLIPPGIEIISFRVPYRWQFTNNNNYIDLSFDVFQVDTMLDDGLDDGTADNDMLFSVYIEDQRIASFVPTPGQNQTLRMPIPRQILADPEQDEYDIRFVLQDYDCGGSQQMRVVVHDTSTIHLEYETLPPSLALVDFPRPLVQELFTPESLLIVLPDDFNEADLSAATAVAATIGQAANKPVTITVSTSSNVTPAQLSDQSVIAIGQPEQNGFITGLYERDLLPTSLSVDGIILDAAGEPISSDFGVLQEILSEENPDNVYVIVTGGSNEAVGKAARALSAKGAQFGMNSNLAIIDAVQMSDIDNATLSEVTALADIGFRDLLWVGRGKHQSSNTFNIPVDWDIKEDAALTFTYIPSSGIDTTQSSLRVELNGNVIGDAPLSPDMVGEQEHTIPLPLLDLQPGHSNRLAFVAELDSDDLCPPLDAPQLWLRIPNIGTLFLPHEINSDQQFGTISGEPFVTYPDLSDALFVLPDEPSDTDLYSLVQLAQIMGQVNDGFGFMPQVQFDSTIDEDTFSDYQVIAVGLPSTNSLITAYNEALPQPFLLGEDALGQIRGDISYQLPPEFSLGVIEYMPAPWGEKRPFIVVSGTTDEGLGWAADALAHGELDGSLDGNLTFVQDAFIESFDLISPKEIAALEESLTSNPDSTIAITSATPQANVEDGANLDATPEATQPLPQDEPNSIPDQYQPPNTTSSDTTTLIGLLIGVGLLLIIGGAFFTWRKSRGRDAT